jgi:hypothetical protein
LYRVTTTSASIRSTGSRPFSITFRIRQEGIQRSSAQVPFFPEPLQARQRPGAIPAEQIVGDVGPGERGVAHVGDEGGWFKIDTPAGLGDEHAEVQVLAHAQQALVERADAVEHAGTHQHAVELAHLGRHARELTPDVGQPLPLPVDDVDEMAPLGSLARPDLDVRLTAREMDELVGRQLLADQRPHDRGAGVPRALHERTQPSRADEDVVVDEDDVLGVDLAQRQVPRAIRR